MYAYRIIASGPEEYLPVVLMHAEQIAEATLEQQVLSVAPEAVAKDIAEGHGTCWDMAIHDVAQLLCDRYGYTLLEYETDYNAQWSCGLCDMFISEERKHHPLHRALTNDNDEALYEHLRRPVPVIEEITQQLRDSAKETAP